MGDTDENSDSDNSKLNQTIAPIRTKADKDKRRAKDFSKELLVSKKMTEQSSSNVPVSQPSRPGVTTATSMSTSSVQSTTRVISIGARENISHPTQDTTNLEFGFNPPVASTVIGTGLPADMKARFDQLDETGRNAIAVSTANHQELCSEIRNSQREVCAAIERMTQMMLTMYSQRNTNPEPASASRAETVPNEPTVLSVNTTSTTHPTETDTGNIVHRAVYTNAPSDRHMNNNYFNNIPNSFMNPPPGFIPRASTQMYDMSQSNLVESGPMSNIPDLRQQPPAVSCPQQGSFIYNSTYYADATDYTQPTSPFFESFLQQQEEILSDQNIQSQTLREQSIKLKQNLVADNCKLEPFKGLKDGRSLVEFLAEFTEFVTPLANNINDRTHMLRNAFNVAYCPQVRSLPRGYTYQQLTRALYDLFWSPEIQTNEYFKFQLSKWPEEDDQSSYDYCLKWINRMKYNEYAKEQIVIRTLCGKIDSKISTSVNASRRMTYYEFLNEVNSAEFSAETTELVNAQQLGEDLAKKQSNKSRTPERVKKKGLFPLASSSTSPEARGNADKMDMDQETTEGECQPTSKNNNNTVAAITTPNRKIIQQREADSIDGDMSSTASISAMLEYTLDNFPKVTFIGDATLAKYKEYVRLHIGKEECHHLINKYMNTPDFLRTLDFGKIHWNKFAVVLVGQSDSVDPKFDFERWTKSFYTLTSSTIAEGKAKYVFVLTIPPFMEKTTDIEYWKRLEKMNRFIVRLAQEFVTCFFIDITTTIVTRLDNNKRYPNNYITPDGRTVYRCETKYFNGTLGNVKLFKNIILTSYSAEAYEAFTRRILERFNFFLEKDQLRKDILQAKTKRAEDFKASVMHQHLRTFLGKLNSDSASDGLTDPKLRDLETDSNSSRDSDEEESRESIRELSLAVMEVGNDLGKSSVCLNKFSDM